MHKIELTAQEKTALEQRHRNTRNVIESDRIKAVLLRSENWTMTAIAQALRVHEGTITRHLKDYLEESKLSISKGGSDSFLSEKQSEQLINHLTQHLYHHAHDIAAYIEEKWSIQYSISGLNKWLHRQGFSYRKTKGRPYKVDWIKQQAFVKKYIRLKASLKPSEKILFIDAVHPSQSTQLSYGWIKKGKTFEISTTASRTRVNILGATPLGNIKDTVTSTFETINAEAVNIFFQELREKYPIKSKLHIILDQSGYHRSSHLKRAAKNLNIRLHYLPPYSPNLNPIERLWKVMNEQVRNNKFFSSAKEFRTKISNFFEETLPQIGNALNERINDNFQKLNPAH